MAGKFEQSEIFAVLVSEMAGESEPQFTPDEITTSEEPEEFKVDANDKELRGTLEIESGDSKGAITMSIAEESNGSVKSLTRGYEYTTEANERKPEPIQKTRAFPEAEVLENERSLNIRQADNSRGNASTRSNPFQNSGIEQPHSSSEPKIAVRRANAEPYDQLLTSAAQVATGRSHIIVRESSINLDQIGVEVQKGPVGVPNLQSAAPFPADNRGQQNAPWEKTGEHNQTALKLPIGENPDALPKPNISGNLTRSQLAMASSQHQNSPQHQTHALSPRLETRSLRASAHSANYSVLVHESEATGDARKLSVAAPSVTQISTNAVAVLNQMDNAKSEIDVLRFGLISTTEPLVQNTASEVNHRLSSSQPSELPRSIARQLAEVSQRMPDRPVEVALNPEELGRVRMSISAHDSGITMALLAERTETLELMRRHIDQLALEFHALGFGDVRFSFSQDSESGEGEVSQHKRGVPALADEPASDVPIRLTISPDAGLDIRL
ncbi:MAG: flagellar hook-length control protein FliK [Paracoccaceae bacterium]